MTPTELDREYRVAFMRAVASLGAVEVDYDVAQQMFQAGVIWGSKMAADECVETVREELQNRRQMR